MRKLVYNCPWQLITAALLFGISSLEVEAGPPKKSALDPPTVSCAGSTQVSIGVTVTAGPSGAPAGFSLQWLTVEELAVGQDGIDGTADDGIWYKKCDASFSGNANDSNYDLAPNAWVTVNVGEFLFDNGASTSCAEVLECGTDYVFQAFAHNVPQGLAKSEWSAQATCSTLSCGSDPGCTLTQGYWKNHPCDWPAPFAPIPILDPETGSPQAGCDCDNTKQLALGNVDYSQCELLAILNTPASGNGLLTLAHQLIAAKLNALNGADVPTEVSDAIAAADALVGDLIVPPSGTGSLATNATSALVELLANYNEGAIGPGHCD